MKIDFKKYVTRLLILAFSAAVISDIIYGKFELANEYLIGQFIGQIFSLSMAFTFVLCLLWFMFEVFFKQIFDHKCMGCINEYPVRNIKKGNKKK